MASSYKIKLNRYPIARIPNVTTPRNTAMRRIFRIFRRMMVSGREGGHSHHEGEHGAQAPRLRQHLGRHVQADDAALRDHMRSDGVFHGRWSGQENARQIHILSGPLESLGQIQVFLIGVGHADGAWTCHHNESIPGKIAEGMGI